MRQGGTGAVRVSSRICVVYDGRPAGRAGREAAVTAEGQPGRPNSAGAQTPRPKAGDVPARERVHHRAAKSRGRIEAELERRVQERTRELERANEALRASEARLSVALAASQAGTFRWLIAADEVEWDDNLRCVFGLAEGRSVRTMAQFLDFVHPDDRGLVVETVERAIREGTEPHMDFRIVRPDGEVRWIADRARVLRDARGTPTHLVGACMDITERKRTEERLRESEERYRTLVEMSPDAVYVHEKPTIILANRQAALLLGAEEPAQLIGRRVFDHIAEESLPLALARTARLTAPGVRNPPVEMIFRRIDGSLVPVEAASAAVLVDGRLAVQVTLRDITERRAAEARQRLLLAELSHRVKNTLAVVQSIASQSLAGERSLAEARGAFTSRLQALARTHDLLTASGWQGVSLRALVARVLEPYGERAQVEGDEVLLTARAALTLGLVLHELATNAAKYGALGSAEGRIAIAWWSAPETGLRLRWREEGGPVVPPTTRRGFGRTLIEFAVAYDLGGRARLEFPPEGVVCELNAPLAGVTAELAPNRPAPGGHGDGLS
jgi:PAS domain S-box-containing protein